MLARCLLLCSLSIGFFFVKQGSWWLWPSDLKGFADTSGFEERVRVSAGWVRTRTRSRSRTVRTYNIAENSSSHHRLRVSQRKTRAGAEEAASASVLPPPPRVTSPRPVDLNEDISDAVSRLGFGDDSIFDDALP